MNSKLLSSLERCAFLLQAIANGNHQALDNAQDAYDEAVVILREHGIEPEWLQEVEDEQC